MGRPWLKLFGMSSYATKFSRDARRVTADRRLRQTIRTALHNYEIARDQRQAAFQDWQTARQAAAETKWEAINPLPQHLADFADKLAVRGTKVHWASTGQTGARHHRRHRAEPGARVPSSNPRR